MAGMTIRNLDDALKARLRVRAAQHGHSMEEEARDILRAALSSDATPTGNLADRIRLRMAAAGGGVDLPLPSREAIRDAPDLSA